MRDKESGNFTITFGSFGGTKAIPFVSKTALGTT